MATLLAATLGAGAACESPSPWRGAGHPPDRISLVRVFPRTTDQSLDYRAPMEKGEAIEMMVRGGLRMAVEPGGVIVAPLTMGIGAFIAWVRGVPEDERMQAEAIITNALVRADLPGRFCQEISEALQEKLRCSTTVGSPPPTRGEATDRDDELWLIVDRLDLRLEAPGDGETAINPRLSFRLETSFSIRTPEGTELCYDRCSVRGERRTFTRWAEEGGEPLRREFERCAFRASRELVEKTFIRWRGNP